MSSNTFVIAKLLGFPPFVVLSLLVWGCGASAPMMEPEAAPIAPAAVEDVDGLVPYLEAYGISVVQVYLDSSPTDALLEKRYVLDLGVQGRCSIEAFYSEQAAQQFGNRSANEVRDLRGPISTNLLRNPAPRGRPGVPNNPTFPYGRFVATCQQDATVRRAFRALELYARDTRDATSAETEADDS